MNKIFLLAFLLAPITFPIHTAIAADNVCQCQPASSVLLAFELANVIFSGQLVEIKNGYSKQPAPGAAAKPDFQELVFDVYQAWKGTVRKQVSLFRFVNDPCSYAFEPGKEYVVFADKTTTDVYRYHPSPGAPQILDSTKCSGTTLLENGDAVRKALGPGNVPY